MRVSCKRVVLTAVACPIFFIVWTQWSSQICSCKVPREAMEQLPAICWTKRETHVQPQTVGLNSPDLETKNEGSTNWIEKNKPHVLTQGMTKGKLTAHRQGEIFSVSGRVELNLMFPKHVPIPLTVNSGYLIQNPEICASSPSLLYVVVVHSAPNHFDRRQSMRQTWANQNLSTSTTSRTIFLLGRRPDHRLQAAIVIENQKYRDIVQGDFIDSYRNLTLKAVMGLRWLTKNCRNARFVVKVDDDVFVNIIQVKRNYFPDLDKNPLQIICQADFCGLIVRHEYPQWILPAEYFKNFSCFPMPMCHGYAAFYTLQLAEQLFEKAKTTPFLYLEDVYTLGIVAAQIQNITWRDERRRFFIFEQDTKNVIKGKDPTKLFVGTVRSRELMNKLWTFVSRDQYEGNNTIV